MVTMSDIAYTVAVIENSYEAWDEEHGIDTDGEGENTKCIEDQRRRSR
jgi:hypothetical protein